MNIKVLGGGCKSCEALLKSVKEAVANKEINAEIEYITDMEKIIGYGVMSMPALMIDDKIVSAGKVLKAKDVEKKKKKKKDKAPHYWQMRRLPMAQLRRGRR